MTGQLKAVPDKKNNITIRQLIIMRITEKFAFCPVCGSSHFTTDSVKSKKCDNCGFEYFVNPASSNAAFILDNEGRLLVERRLREPAKGTLDLPGGFADAGETAEEGVIAGGAGSCVLELLAREALCVPLLQVGIPDQFIDHGDVDVLFERCGMDPASVRKKIDAMLKKICVNGACSA